MALSHLRLQLDRLTVDDEPAVSVMVDGLGVLLRRVRPGFQHLDDKEVVSVDKAGVGYHAFEIGKTFGHERRPTGCGFLKAGEFGCKPLRSWDFCWRAEFGVNPIAGRPEWPKVGTGNAISS